jgi:hypothetical protein
MSAALPSGDFCSPGGRAIGAQREASKRQLPCCLSKRCVANIREAALSYDTIGSSLVFAFMSAVRIGLQVEGGSRSAGFAFSACSSSAAGTGRLRA